MLVSQKQPCIGYVGRTNNFRRRLMEHRDGVGSEQTKPDELRPWLPVMIITGFHNKHQDADDDEDRLQYHLANCESAWRHYNNGRNIFGMRCDFSPVMEKNGLVVFTEFASEMHNNKSRFPDLRLIKFLDIVRSKYIIQSQCSQRKIQT